MKHVGKSYPIHDAVNKVTGRAVYAGDMELAGMLHLAILFSPIPHGWVRKLDCSKALAYPGVVDVIHCFNTTTKDYNRYHTQFRQPLIHNEHVFNEHVRFVGDRVAGVIARTPEIAREAVKLIEAEYEELPYSLDMFDTLDGRIDDVHEQGAIYGSFENVCGTMPEIPDLVNVETTTWLSRINHMCMETHCCVADYDKGLNHLTIYSPNQAVFGIRSVIADLFEMDYQNVRVVKTTMGGSFGAKQEWIMEPVAAAAALKVGRPVRLVYNRSETMVSTISRSPMYFKTGFQFTRDGKLQGVDCDLTLDAGAYLGNSYNYATAMSYKFFRVYKYPFRKFVSRAVITNTTVSGAFRGWTSPEMTIMFEHNMNMAARKLGMDAIDIRLQNVMDEGDIDPMIDVSVGDFKGRKALLMGREEFKWEQKKEEIREFNASNRRFKRGQGVAIGGHVNGFYPTKPDFTRVDMRMTESGSVLCNVTLHDHGCGTVTAFQMMAAEELGLNISQVRIKEGDTDNTPLDFGCFSSRTIYVIGRATVECAKKLKERMCECFAALEKIDAEDVVSHGGVVSSKSKPELTYTWIDLVHKCQQIYQHEIFASYEYVNETNPGVAGVHLAMVEVDTYTGMTKIMDYLAVHDLGQAINREICEAQTQGAVIMGSGAALTEHVRIHPSGRSINSLKDYHLINSFEAPDVKVLFIEEGNTQGPYGAKTIGEVCHVPVTAAIVGAVNDALQSDMNHIPLSPDVITKYLSDREAKQA